MLIRGDGGGGGKGGGKKELLLGVFFAFRGALGLYGSLGCVSKAALTEKLPDRITIEASLSSLVLPFELVSNDKATRRFVSCYVVVLGIWALIGLLLLGLLCFYAFYFSIGLEGLLLISAPI